VSVCAGEASCVIENRKTERQKPAFGFCPAEDCQHRGSKGHCLRGQNKVTLLYSKFKKKKKKPSS
jgi:hypothetical protein